MKKYLTPLFLSAIMSLPLSSAQASDISGISPKATYELLQQKPDEVLFIDVRDPIEIMFIGFTDEVDLNIPYLMVDRSQWDAKKNRFRLYQNPDFATQVEQALLERGLDKQATVITMCRSGSERGLPSAEFLRKHGFPNATYMINGFQGDSAKAGKKTGFRIQNGWQNSGLPWSAKPNPDKIYRIDR
ncbi:rhodanese-like domain-containing protein [Neptuniibacter pectenicola]|uniref:rhodanese-like domain-containing protein n=1 Tax=Neptuniibacter pectenicola TaxID=1806669 RepID=UPI00082A9C19|nr:rhodanese-like domain-containing protein [Neptuniibacter pectenicola]